MFAVPHDGNPHVRPTTEGIACGANRCTTLISAGQLTALSTRSARHNIPHVPRSDLAPGEHKAQDREFRFRDRDATRAREPLPGKRLHRAWFISEMVH